jgi:hypothetical protein
MRRPKSKLFAVLVIVLLLSMGFMSCYGNFSLVKKLYLWNGTVGSKFANSAVMWILFIVPVYEVAGFIDFVILNVIEFWTGENPVKMSEGDRETQIVKKDGKEYQITATKNRLTVMDLANKDRHVSLIYKEDSNSWYVETQDGLVKVAEYAENNQDNLVLIFPDQKTFSIDLTTHPMPLEYTP